MTRDRALPQPSRPVRMIKGIGALLVLVAAVVGIPVALIALAGNPLPAHPSVGGLWHALTTPDDGGILIGLVAVIAWVAWLVFAISVITELIAVISRQRIRIRLPGLGGAQKVAGGLILLVLAVFLAPQQLAAAEPRVPDPGSGPTVVSTAPQDADPDTDRGVAGTPATTATGAGAGRADAPGDGDPAAATHADDPLTVLHRVREGDDLWSLAERYYGHGTQWRRIAAANPSVLSGGPDRLEPGWTLRIPEVRHGDRQVRVRTGDTLSGLAEREYGDAGQWRRIFEANTDRLDDPDQLPVGVTLTLPAVDATGPEATAAATSGRDQSPSRAPDRTDRPAGDRDRTDRRDGRSDAQHEKGPDRAPASPAAGSTGDGRSDDRQVPTTAAPTTGATTAPTTAPTRPPTERAADPGTASGVPDGAGSAADDEPEPLPPRGSEIAPQALRISGIGAVLAAAVIGGLFTRRQLQLHGRAVGRRIPHPQPEALQVEARLGRQQDRFGLDRLDLALRAIGRECRLEDRPVPRLLAARLAEDAITLTMAAPELPAPAGFAVDGQEWRLTLEDASRLLQDQELADCPSPIRR